MTSVGLLGLDLVYGGYLFFLKRNELRSWCLPQARMCRAHLSDGLQILRHHELVSGQVCSKWLTIPKTFCLG